MHGNKKAPEIHRRSLKIKCFFPYKQPTWPETVTVGKAEPDCRQAMFEKVPVILLPEMVTTTLPAAEYQVVPVGCPVGFVTVMKALPPPDKAAELLTRA